jgi:radical SAM superfamily enzyme YgiQ (UPF0313 family)
MKVLVLNPPFVKYYCRTERWAAVTRGRTLRPPDWLAMTAAILRKDGHEIKLVDGPALDLNEAQVHDIIREFKPDFAVVDCCTPSVYSDIAFAKACKELAGAKVLLVGPHPSAVVEETTKLAKGAADAIAIGEYDYIVRDYARALARGESASNTRGIAYMEGDQVVRTAPMPVIENLDEIPFPTWDQIDVTKYWDSSKRHPYITIISGRGCPNRCTFCFWPQVMHGRRYRLRSAKNVVDEMEYDLKLFPNLKEIMFEDDTLTADRKRASQICDEIMARGIHKKVSWAANARADLDDLELLKKMKRAGCRMFVTGFESGNPEILKTIHKNTTIEKMRLFSKLCKKAGILVHGCFMIGLPGETKATARETINLTKMLDPDTIQISAAVPFPGTEFYDWAGKSGFLRVSDWREYLNPVGEQATFIGYPGLSTNEINELVDKGLREFYFRPSKFFALARRAIRPADFPRYFYGMRQFLSYLMGKQRLEKRVSTS